MIGKWKVQSQLWDTAGQERFRSMVRETKDAIVLSRSLPALIETYQSTVCASLDLQQAPMYYRGAHAAILVFDITIPETLDKVAEWVEELRHHVGGSMGSCMDD